MRFVPCLLLVGGLQSLIQAAAEPSPSDQICTSQEVLCFNPNTGQRECMLPEECDTPNPSEPACPSGEVLCFNPNTGDRECLAPDACDFPAPACLESEVLCYGVNGTRACLPPSECVLADPADQICPDGEVLCYDSVEDERYCDLLANCHELLPPDDQICPWDEILCFDEMTDSRFCATQAECDAIVVPVITCEPNEAPCTLSDGNVTCLPEDLCNSLANCPENEILCIGSQDDRFCASPTDCEMMNGTVPNPSDMFCATDEILCYDEGSGSRFCATVSECEDSLTPSPSFELCSPSEVLCFIPGSGHRECMSLEECSNMFPIPSDQVCDANETHCFDPFSGERFCFPGMECPSCGEGEHPCPTINGTLFTCLKNEEQCPKPEELFCGDLQPCFQWDFERYANGTHQVECVGPEEQCYHYSGCRIDQVPCFYVAEPEQCLGINFFDPNIQDQIPEFCRPEFRACASSENDCPSDTFSGNVSVGLRCPFGQRWCDTFGSCIFWDVHCPYDGEVTDQCILSGQSRCKYDNLCLWNGADCANREPLLPGNCGHDRVCPDGRCAREEYECYGYPPSHCQPWEVVCQDDSCAYSSADCYLEIGCPSNSTDCGNGICTKDEEDCVRFSEPCSAGQVRCLDGHCATDFMSCPQCPFTHTNRCDDGRCLTTEDSCEDECSFPLISCWDGSCAWDHTECNCYPTQPYRCPDGRCTDNPVECDQGLESRCNSTSQDAWFPCLTGGCATPLTCPCPQGTVRCETTGYCVRAEEDCGMISGSCPFEYPVLCWDGVCERSSSNCRCPYEEPFRCPNGDCVKTVEECVAILKTDKCPQERPYRCPFDRSCRKTPMDCANDVQCPPKMVKCSDASCQFNFEDCPPLPTCLESEVRCANGDCAASLGQCPTGITCPAHFVLCSDGCYPELLGCSDTSILQCPSAQFLCSSIPVCRRNKEDCPADTSCTTATPVKCPDGSCAESFADCPEFVFENLFSRLFDCDVESEVRCFDGTCAPSPSECPAVIQCPFDASFLCPDGRSCVSHIDDCIGNFECPTNFTKCPDGITCLPSDEVANSTCPSQQYCPEDEPILCGADRSCAATVKECSQRQLSFLAEILANETDITFDPANISSIHEVDFSSISNKSLGEIAQKLHEKVTTMCPGDWTMCSDGYCEPRADLCPAGSLCPRGDVLCADASCRKAEDCPSSAELECPEDMERCPSGDCAFALYMCPQEVKCPTGYVKCFNNECVTNVDFCPSFGDDFTCDGVVCSTGDCVPSFAYCPTALKCPEERPYRCFDDSCRVSSDYCPEVQSCPSGYVRCPDRTCQTGYDQCSTLVTCPMDLPVRCEDGSCRLFSEDCPVLEDCTSEAPYRCPDGTCIANMTNCHVEEPCPSETPVRCPDRTCQPSVANCTAEVKCPSYIPFSCPGGRCVETAAECPTLRCPGEFEEKCDGGQCVDTRQSECPDVGCTMFKPVACTSEDGWFVCAKRPEECDALLGEVQVETCPVDVPIVCPDGSCRATVGECPANANGCPVDKPFRCSNKECVEDATQCAPPSVCPGTALKCPDGRCRRSIIECPPIRICLGDPGGPLMCADGSCVSNLDLCEAIAPCASSEVRCGDGTCRTSVDLCPKFNTCPENYPVRCADGACEVDEQMCLPVEGGGCPASNPVQCKEQGGECRQTEEDCADIRVILPNGCDSSEPFKCPNGECIDDINSCLNEFNCPLSEPYRCPDGECAVASVNCSELTGCPPARPVQCQSDGACVASISACKTKNGCPITTPFRCPGGRCALRKSGGRARQGCEPQIICPGNRPVRCQSGACVATEDQCKPVTPCAEGEERCTDGFCATVGSCRPRCPQGMVQCSFDGSCQISLLDCVAAAAAEEQCASDTPIQCIDGTCAATYKQCRDRVRVDETTSLCPEGELECPEGSCVTDLSDCSPVQRCPREKPQRCPDGSCITAAQSCVIEVVCDLEICPDGSCREVCPPYNGCPVGQIQCANGICVPAADIAVCRGGCPEGEEKCFDGACASECPTAPVNKELLPTAFTIFDQEASIDVVTTDGKKTAGMTVSPNAFISAGTEALLQEEEEGLVRELTLKDVPLSKIVSCYTADGDPCVETILSVGIEVTLTGAGDLVPGVLTAKHTNCSVVQEEFSEPVEMTFWVKANEEDELACRYVDEQGQWHFDQMATFVRNLTTEEKASAGDDSTAEFSCSVLHFSSWYVSSDVNTMSGGETEAPTTTSVLTTTSAPTTTAASLPQEEGDGSAAISPQLLVYTLVVLAIVGNLELLHLGALRALW